MKTLLIISLLLALSNHVFSQQTETDAVKQSVNTFFEGMHKRDSVMIKSVLSKDMILQSIGKQKDGSINLDTQTCGGFIKLITITLKDVVEERITFKDIKIDKDMATVWAPYRFYFGDKFSHCGTDVIQLMKIGDKWKITYIAFNMRKDNCPE